MAIVIQTLSDSAQARRDLSQLKSSVEGIKTSTENFSRRFGNMAKVLAVGAVAVTTARGFMKLSDSLTILENKMAAVTKTSRDASNALYMVKKIAIETRTDLDSTASLYQRISVAAQSMGASQRQVAAVVKATGQAMKISGANSIEAANAIRQFAQVMGSGKFQGDEFRAIMEAAPTFIHEIAKGMGVTIKQMYAMKEAGTLTNRVVFEGLLRRTEAINAQFGKMRVTYGEAFTNLGTSLLMLFGAVKKAFLGAEGGFAMTINGWAEGIADFANKFGYYILAAQTKAYVFIVDTMTMFTELWEGIKEGAKVLWGIVKDFVAFLKPYLAIASAAFVALAKTIYQGSSKAFFTFMSFLKKHDSTKTLAKYLEAANIRMLSTFKNMRQILNSIDFSKLLIKTRDQLRAFYETLRNIDLSAIGRRITEWFRNFDLLEALRALRINLQKMYNRIGNFDFSAFARSFKESMAAALAKVKAIDVSAFIPNLDKALTTVKLWAQKVANWFKWLYDVVIGNSYIPDLVKGVIKWFKVLLGSPLAIAGVFVAAVGKIFGRLRIGNPFVMLTAGLGSAWVLLKRIAPLTLALAAAVGAAKLAKDYVDANGGVGDTLQGITDSLKSHFDSFIAKLKEIYNRIRNKLDTGGMAARETVGQFTKLPFAAMFFDIFPKDKQVAVGLGITAAMVAPLLAFFSSGPLRAVLISLATTMGLAFMGRGIDQKTIWEFIAKAASRFIDYLDKGIQGIMGRRIAQDPFGFLALIAKTSLLFKAGRDYFLTLAKNIITSPTAAAQTFVDMSVLKLRDRNIAKLEERRLTELPPLKIEARAAEARLGVATGTLAAQRNVLTGQPIGAAQAKLMLDPRLQGPMPLDAAGHAALEAARASNIVKEKAANDLKQTADTIATAIKAETEGSKTLREKLKAGAESFRAGLSNLISGAGGAIGAGIGMQLGRDAVAGIKQAKLDKAIEGLVTVGLRRADGTRASASEIAEAAQTGDFSGFEAASRKFAEDFISEATKISAWQNVGTVVGYAAVGQFIGAMAGAAAVAGAQWIASTKLAGAIWTAITNASKAAWVAVQPVAAWAYGKTMRVIGLAWVAVQAVAAAAFATFIALWPVLLIAAITAGLIYLARNWDQVKAVIDKTWKAVLKWLKDTASEVGRILWDKITGAFKPIIDFFSGNAFKESVNRAYKDIPRDRAQTVGENTRGSKLASGGYISGPGTGRSDSIPAMLSNGEYVINAAATSQNRALLEAINNGRGFAAGGLITPGVSTKGNYINQISIVQVRAMRKKVEEELQTIYGKPSIFREKDEDGNLITVTIDNFEASEFNNPRFKALKERLDFLNKLENQIWKRDFARKFPFRRPFRDRLPKRGSKNFIDRTNKWFAPITNLDSTLLDELYDWKRKASGGYISGPGSKQSDSIPAMLSNGEYVINADATAKNRALLEAINSGKPFAKFASGGAVGSDLDFLRASAKHNLDEAIRARSEAKGSYLQAMGDRLVAKWKAWFEDMDGLANFLSGETGKTLSGIDEGDSDEDKKKKAKARREREKKPTPNDTDDFAVISEMFPKLALSLQEYYKLSEEAQQGLVKDAYIAQGRFELARLAPPGSPLAFNLARAAERERSQREEEAILLTKPERVPWGSVKGQIEKLGIDITEAFYNSLAPDAVQVVEDYIKRMQTTADTRADVNVGAEAKRLAEIQAVRLTKDFEEFKEMVGIKTYGTAFDLFAKEVSKGGFEIDEMAYFKATDAVRARVREISLRTKELLERMRRGAFDPEALREYEALTKEREGLLGTPEDKAKEAGKSFAQKMHDAFTSGLQEFLKTGDPKNLLKGLIDTFTNGIIDAYVEAFTEPLTGEKGVLGKLFADLGSTVYKGGGIAGQQVAGPLQTGVNAVSGVANNLLGGATKIGEGMLEPIAETAMPVGVDMATGIAEQAPAIGNLVGKSTVDTVAKAGAGGSAGGGMIGLAGMAGGIFGLLLGKLLFKSSGGPVVGPGTGRSDSIPAMLSNGEFVVNAKAAGKNRRLLTAINSNKLPQLADGGFITAPTKSYDGIPVGNRSTIVNLNVTGDISRQTKKEIYESLPMIADGVNSVNRERGVR